MKGEGEVIRISIPDDEVVGWMQTLREGGFNDEEIDKILSHLNSEYARAIGEKRLATPEFNLKKFLEESLGRPVSDEETKEAGMVMQAFFENLNPPEK